MKTASPLRYPGGKSALSGLLASIRRINGFGDKSIAEPFAGGAGASLCLLYLEETHKIFINDADPAIHDLWWTLVHRPGPFIDMISDVDVNVKEWQLQRKTYEQNGGVSRLRRGFAAFYLNRCNRSGILMNAGPIGGLEQEGKWRIDARFNKVALRQRCEKVSEYGKRIVVSCQDGIEFIKRLASESVFFFIDPPYYEKGPTLYLNALDHKYHLDLSKQLKSMSDIPWVLSYDDCREIRNMYKGWANIRPFSLNYIAAKRRSGKEVLITPKWMRLPDRQTSASVVW